MVAAAAESVVVTATLEATCSMPYIFRLEPRLNPYHPNQRMKVPVARVARGACGYVRIERRQCVVEVVRGD